MSTSIQTDYKLYFLQAKAGMLGDLRENIQESYAAESEFNFGMAAVRGTDPVGQIIKAVATGGIFRGITVAAFTLEQSLLSGSISDSVGKYLINDMVPVMRRGQIWVKVVQDVLVDDPVYFVHTNVDPTKIGYFRKDADTANADLVPTGVFRTAALAGGLALVEINLP
jgi:hypothetical protein